MENLLEGLPFKEFAKTKKGSHKPTAELEDVLFNSKEGSGFLANIIASSIIQANPIHRQANYFVSTLKKDIPKKTLYTSALRATEEYLWPLYEQMRLDIRKAPLIQADETTHRCPEVTRLGGNVKSTVIVACTNDHFPFSICLYIFRPDKKIEFVDELVGPNYKGCLHKDGFPRNLGESDKLAFRSIAGGCLMHARRYFIKLEESRAVSKELKNNKVANKARKRKAIEEARADDDILDQTETILELFGHIFRMEKKMNKDGADDLTVYTVRNTEIKAILEELDIRIEKLMKEAPTNSKVQQAGNYYFNNKACLWHFLVDPAYKIDTSHVERQVRAFSTYRKNSLFNTTIRGARMNCCAMSLLRTCVLNGIDPYGWLKWVFSELRNKRNHITGQIPLNILRKYLPYSPYVPKDLRVDRPACTDSIYAQKLKAHPNLVALASPTNPMDIQFFDPDNPLYDIIPLPMGLSREDLLSMLKK